MEKESMKAYLCAMKNTRVRVTGRNPLTFTVNGCEDLQEFRERLFNAQFDALGYCAGVLDGGAANAGTIRVLRAMLKGVRNTILLDKQGRPHRPLLHVEEGGEKNLRARPRLAAGVGALHRRANRIAGTGAGRVGGKAAGVRLPLPLHRKPHRAGALRPGAFHHGQDSPRRRSQNAALRPPSPVAAPRPGRPEPLERHQQADPDRKATPLLRRLPRRP